MTDQTTTDRDDIAVLLGRIADLEGQLAKVTARHRPQRRYTTLGETSYATREEAAEAYDTSVDDIGHFDVCEHCGRLEADDYGRGYRESLWPCPDATALGLDELDEEASDER